MSNDARCPKCDSPTKQFIMEYGDSFANDRETIPPHVPMREQPDLHFVYCPTCKWRKCLGEVEILHG